MRINHNYHIAMERKTKKITTNLFDGRIRDYFPTDTDYSKFSRILTVCRKRACTLENKNVTLRRLMIGFFNEINEDNVGAYLFPVTVTKNTTDTTTIDTSVAKTAMKNTIQKLMDFFSEFKIVPSARFINNLAFVENPTKYVVNYYAIQGHTYASEIATKTQSYEWKEIAKEFKNCTPTKGRINSRLSMYFGAPGTGKTYKASEEAETVIVCSSDMLPTDLMQNFDFVDGHATYKKSEIWKAMEEGRTICLDEVNLLPFESIRFLQGITDGKTEFSFKGETITIHPDFKIIGTMNLTVNGQVVSVPEPIADRCGEITEFTMDAERLVGTIF